MSTLSPVEGSLKLKSGAYFVPNNKSFIGWDGGVQETSRGVFLDIMKGIWADLEDGQDDFMGKLLVWQARAG